LSQTPFSLPKQAKGNRFKKTLLLARNPERNLWDKGSASDAGGFHLFIFGRAVFFNAESLTGMPTHACFYFSALSGAIAKSKRNPHPQPFSLREKGGKGKQESGRQMVRMFIEYRQQKENL
jgi:hypothetical protein